MVMMCSSRLLLISSIMAAKEVLFPEPVGPVHSTNPRGFLVRSCTTGGRPSCSTPTMSAGIRLNAAPMALRWKYEFTRKRARPGIE